MQKLITPNHFKVYIFMSIDQKLNFEKLHDSNCANKYSKFPF
jgi:hypothetical protein